MSADGRASAVVVRSTIGRANASVFPDPVGDFSSTSRPARASGRTRGWIRNGSWVERAARAAAAGGGTPKSREELGLKVLYPFFWVGTLLTPKNPRRRE